MNTRVFSINASFAVILFVYLTLDLKFKELSFLRFREEGTRGFVVAEGAGSFVFFSFFSSSSFCFTSCVMTIFICLVSV
jgi:hypothetical protein